MATALRVLLIEDSDDDALLLLRELRRGGFDPIWQRVDTPEALHEALDGADWDLITCDWVMPKFSAPAALELLRARRCDVPVIIVSGEVGEEVAVSALRSGARDYVSKQKLTRLVPAITRELEEFADQRARRQAEASLRRAQDRLRIFFEQASDLIFTLDGEGRITSVNAAVREMLGYAPAELVGCVGLDLLAPEGRPQGLMALQGIRSGEPIERFEFDVLAKNGETRVLEIRGHAVHWADGPMETFHIARDVTERRRAEAERARLSAALEQAPEPIAITDADGTVVYLNPAGERLTGVSRAEAQGRPYATLSGSNGGDGSWSRSMIQRREDGSLVRIEVTVSPIRDAAGRIVNYVGGLRDDEDAPGSAAASR
jgi:sigma-B regulation protein RsbU (phosphoserine phosphatase)